MRVERYEIHRRIVALKNQIQSQWLIFEHTLHRARLYPAVNPALKLECCSVHCSRRVAGDSGRYTPKIDKNA
jgi:hypothetical protein